VSPDQEKADRQIALPGPGDLNVADFNIDLGWRVK